MANSQDRDLNSISVDSDQLIKGIRAELDIILIQENLNPHDYCFVTLAINNIYGYNVENNAVASLSVKHTPKPNRCSHCDIEIDTNEKIKPGSSLSNAKFKKLKRSLAKMVYKIIFNDQTIEI